MTGTRIKITFLSVSLLALIGAISTLSVENPVRTTVELDLGGADWSVVNTNGSWSVDAQCVVPGDIYTDLLRMGKIGEPFYRYGDVEYRWIAYDNWTYSKKFVISTNITASGFPANSVILEFEGLQVVANISLNGVLVGSAADQFQQHRFDVTSIVNKAVAASGSAPTEMTVTVAFMSSVLYGKAQYNAYALGPKPDAPAYLVGLPYRNMIRAEQSSFGWDWGPAFAPQGIYRPVRMLLDLDEAAASHVTARILHVVPHVFPTPYNHTVDHPLTDTNNSFWIPVEVYVVVTASASSGIATLRVNVSLSAPSMNGAFNSTIATIPVGLHLSENCAQLELNVKNVLLWWPNGYGRPNLHDLIVTVSNAATGAMLATSTVRTGVRSVELITFGDPLSYRPTVLSATFGERASSQDAVSDRPVMFFRINGIPIFAQGANLVPFDAFQGRVNETDMENILDSAIDANMNMVRVWGGGIFPLESFYTMADHKGIMLWQEMIFACAEYPIDQPFLSKVRSEISYQLRRLSFHPSIVMWSGNNENGIYDFGPGSPYEILDYQNVLHQIIREDTARPIWPSSPSTGFASGVTASGLPAGSRTNPLPFKVGGKSGDTHWYNYFDCPNVNLYPQTNFGSEFGFQSLPWFDNIAPMCLPEDWSLFTTFMNHRQHHPDGNAQIAALLTQNFQVPDLNSTELAIFKRVIFLSQLQQVLCIADEASFYKRGRNMPYRTMGSLYWQLNQNWQAPSWTSLEYGGEWKVLHYAMRTVYDKLHLSGFYNSTSDAIMAHVASNHLEDIGGSVVSIEAVSLAPQKGRLLVENVPLDTIPALSGVFYWTVKKSALLANSSNGMSKLCPSDTSCFLYFSLRKSDASAELLCQPQPIWLNTVKNLLVDGDAQVIVNVTSVALEQAELSVSVSATSGPALYVVLRNTKYKGVFSENMIVLLPGDAPRTVHFHGRKNMNHGHRQLIESIADFQANTVVEFLNQMW
jgi:beta-mannosidase